MKRERPPFPLEWVGVCIDPYDEGIVERMTCHEEAQNSNPVGF